MPRLFGAKLRYLRRQHSLIQADLAAELQGASQAHVSNLEAGRFEPSLDLVIHVADLFGVATDYLLRDTIPPEGSGASTFAPVYNPDPLRHHVSSEASAARAAPSSVPTSKLFGEKLKYLRLRDNMTQAQLARQLALKTHSHVSYLETGRKEPSLDLVLRIADLLGVTTDYMLRDTIPVEAVDLDRGDTV